SSRKGRRSSVTVRHERAATRMIRGGAVVLSVSDVGRAVRFYVETLGMKLVEESADGSAVIDAGEGFHLSLEKGVGPPGSIVRLYPKLATDEVIPIFENRGVVFTTDRSGSTVVARFDDPDGNKLCLAGS